MDSNTFESIRPSRYISFTLPALSIPNLKPYLHTHHIRFAILDSQSQPTNPDNPPLIAAMIVPKNREKDWIFNTEAGHFQLLSGATGVSRLILIGNTTSSDECGPVGDELACVEKLEDVLYPFLVVLNQEMGEFEITFLRYEDSVVKGVVLERVVGPVVGEILVEDVEIEGLEREFRRRLRFKRMPNLVQSQIKIVPMGNNCGYLGVRDVKFEPDLGVLMHIYLAAIVASLSLISGYVQGCIDGGIRPRALCVGVGGGALLGFLASQLGFQVVGVEADREVLRVARKYFGLEQCESVRVFVGDGIEFMKSMACNDLGAFGTSGVEIGCRKFDVIMVDLDPGDFRTDTSVPPSEFMQESVLLAAKGCLCDVGLLVLNVIPPDKLVYENLKQRLKEVFIELYEIDTGNEENFVVIATMSRTDAAARVHENAFLTKLRSVTSGAFVDTIRKI